MPNPARRRRRRSARRDAARDRHRRQGAPWTSTRPARQVTSVERSAQPPAIAGRQTASRLAVPASRTSPTAATIAILATMLGVAVGLLLALARTPSPAAIVKPAAAEEAAIPADPAPW